MSKGADAGTAASGLGPATARVDEGGAADDSEAKLQPTGLGADTTAVPARSSSAGRRRTGPYGNGGFAAGRRTRGPLYAALDLGTNNCRLLIAEPASEGFRVVDSFSRIVRLGEGLAQSGALKPDAMDRAVGALRICAQKLRDRQVERARLIATEACRRAANGTTFLERVRDEVGLDLEIIDRRTEAGLAVEGCSSLLDPKAEGAVLFDIGGGSSEIVWLDRRKSRRSKGLIRAWVSLPVGVVTLAERHGGVDVNETVFEAMVEEVRSEFQLFRARDALKKAVSERAFHFLGTSGTVTTLAGVFLGLARYDRRFVDGLWMDDADIQRMMTKITAMTYDTRVANPCIGHQRADLVLAGCAIFEAIRREWPCQRLRVADRGLREGILTQLMRADGYLRRGGSGGHGRA
jgi:exopolyphosphatase/guanosine-5'-triphosphate,3'-diphosphate pyrophosphatase